MTPDALRTLIATRPLLLDGGLGSLLIAQGLEPGRSPVDWNLERPEAVRDTARRYSQAGSDIVHTNTFGASPPKLAAAGLGGRCAEVNAVAVRLAREGCVGSACLVAGDIGPTGLHYPPMGTATRTKLLEAFTEQAGALAAAGVDLLSVETMYDLREALAALQACRTTGLPALVSMTFDAKKRGFFTIMGDPLVASLQALAEAGAVAVGMNCSVTSPVMMEMVRQAVAAVSTPLVAQPNAGQPRPTPAGVVYDADPAAFATDLAAMVQAGARLVGGCCGTDDTFIAAARRAVSR
ncbi:MAG TPA: homocysteine S-methyltransferase family protein [Thermoanaerobaculaceae bacterium]|nr:homocysteine S-methyltransferase family protein [Thermoanaerobaculaceae bacterium]HPS78992.1 homocysteine S-methyltransferase family protein [Thermoanaerobaculaceae bacterium]